MNYWKNIIASVFILFVFTVDMVAQQKLSSSNKKAIKLYQEGKGYYDRRNNELAELTFLAALEKDPNFAEAELLLAYVYLEQNAYDKAIEHYEKCIKISPNLFPEIYFDLGGLYINQGKYEAAKGHFSTYLNYGKLMHSTMATHGLRDCEFAIEAMKSPVPFAPVNMGESINTPLPEYFPSITADGKTLLFTRRLNDKRTYTGYNEDFFISYHNGSNWSKGRNVQPINSLTNEGAPTFSSNGRFLIFTSCNDPVENYGKGKTGHGSCDLFYTYKIGDNWTAPKNLNTPINTKNWESQPSFSSDGKTLYFVRGSRTRGGIKNQDIYVSELSEGGIWGAPEKLSDVINTPFSEESVFIHPDGKTLYFSSNGHTGMGGLDIFVSKKDKDGNWSKPKNLGYPINTFNDENSLLVSADGKLAYFASNREGGYGSLDLYQFELPESARPEPVTYLAGRVYDAVSKKPLEARFELIDLETGDLVVQSYADKITGEYLVCLPSSRDYALNASHDGYLFFSENFTLTGSNSTDPYQKNVPLDQIKVGEKVVLKNVFFETSKFDLKPKSKVELDKLIEFLSENNLIKIELGGHTDNVGDSKSNQLLSQQRAEAVYTYLVDGGISSDRLSTKGYGDTMPIADNDTEKGRAENRRTEFKIIEK